MNWNYIKDKIQVFGKDDYVFADMFISIIKTFDDIHNKEDIKLYTLKMLQELLKEKSIDFYIAKGFDIIPIKYDSDDEIKEIIRMVDKDWSLIGYRLPEPNELFWISLKDDYFFE